MANYLNAKDADCADRSLHTTEKIIKPGGKSTSRDDVRKPFLRTVRASRRVSDYNLRPEHIGSIMMPADNALAKAALVLRFVHALLALQHSNKKPYECQSMIDEA